MITATDRGFRYMEHPSKTSTSMLEGLFDPAADRVWRAFDARFRPILLEVAKKLGLDEADAADAAQETLLRFLGEYRSGKYDRTRGRLRSWVLGILKYRVAEMKRLKGRRREFRGESGIVEIPNDQELDLVWSSARRAAILRLAMTELNTNRHVAGKTLQAFDAFVIRHHPAAQVARELNMSVNGVYVAKNRVAEKLREIIARLDQLYDEDP